LAVRAGPLPRADPAWLRSFSLVLFTPADIFGVDLIAERIESESMVIDLLDYDVRFGQGALFSPPRPVRADALQSLGEPVARREATQAPPAPAEPVRASAEGAQLPPPAPQAAEPVAPTEPRPPTEGRVSVLGQIARGMMRRA